MNNQRKIAKQAVRNVTAENIDTYMDMYASMENEEVELIIDQLAIDLWENRGVREIERDRAEGVTLEDYKNWVFYEFLTAGLVDESESE